MVRAHRLTRASSYVRRRAAAEVTGARRVKDLLAVHGLSPRKRMGQNFLIREDVAERIVEHCRLEPDDVAVEIGPGAGALTLGLARRVRHLVTVELDRGLAAVLREELSGFPGTELIEGDFLELDLQALAARWRGWRWSATFPTGSPRPSSSACSSNARR
jgi:16S rRNA (adenine1518-N6/adenine1519-N6)-dimethyltransferase